MSPILEYLLAVRRYWVVFVTGSLPIAVYTVLVLGFPDIQGKTQHLWNHLPQWVVITLALLGVTAAQYLAWRDQRGRTEILKQQLRERGKYNQQAARAAEFDVRYGPNSASRPGARLQSATAFFEKLETEILAGDFSNTGDLLIFKDHFNTLLREWFGTSTGAYQSWHERLVNAVDAVSRHERELAENEP